VRRVRAFVGLDGILPTEGDVSLTLTADHP
jgi:hypothetical protein